MALKAITVRLDEEEYEKLKKYLEEFGDPDINVAFVLRAYIRDLNRAMPFMVQSGMDLKNYFGLLGTWLKQFTLMGEADMFSRMMSPWAYWNMQNGAPGKRSETHETVRGKGKRPGEEPGSKKE